MGEASNNKAVKTRANPNYLFKCRSVLLGDDWEGFSASHAMVLPQIRLNYRIKKQRETTVKTSMQCSF